VKVTRQRGDFAGIGEEDAHNMEMSNTGLHKHNDQLDSHVYAVMEEKKVLYKQLEETKL